MSHNGKVLIAGAGLAGLTLAQSLRKQGIPYEIFERDAGPDAREQGWAIMLQWILPNLLDGVPDDMPDLDKTSVTSNMNPPLPAGMSFYEGDSGKCYASFKSSETGRKAFRSDRGKLREWLETKIPVQWSKRVVSYDQSANGVTVNFDDGSTAHGDILVAADGVQSPIRRQLLGPDGAHPETVPMTMLVYEYDTHGKLTQKLLDMGPSFWAANWADKRVFNGLKHVDATGQHARHYMMLGIEDEGIGSDDHWTHKATPEQLHQALLDSTKEMAPELREFVLATNVEGTRPEPLIMRDMEPVPLPAGRVVLAGDAYHPMTPFRGEGGNHAMQDALDLGRLLGQARGQGQGMTEVLKKYQDLVIKRARITVAQSHEAALSNDSWTELIQEQMDPKKGKE